MDESEDQPLERECDIYKRIKLLGSGSYGRAYLVREVATGQEWAVKQIDLADLSPQEQADAMR
jgi:NIMA (never in mitosis gene a)-related kinase